MTQPQSAITRPIKDLPERGAQGNTPLRELTATLKTNSQKGLATAIDKKRSMSLRAFISAAEQGTHVHQRKDYENPDIIWMWMEKKAA